MDANEYLSGVYLDEHLFSKEDTIKLMEDYHKYKLQKNENCKHIWVSSVAYKGAKVCSICNRYQ